MCRQWPNKPNEDKSAIFYHGFLTWKHRWWDLNSPGTVAQLSREIRDVCFRIWWIWREELQKSLLQGHATLMYFVEFPRLSQICYGRCGIFKWYLIVSVRRRVSSCIRSAHTWLRALMSAKSEKTPSCHRQNSPQCFTFGLLYWKGDIFGWR